MNEWIQWLLSYVCIKFSIAVCIHKGSWICVCISMIHSVIFYLFSFYLLWELTKWLSQREPLINSREMNSFYLLRYVVVQRSIYEHKKFILSDTFTYMYEFFVCTNLFLYGFNGNGNSVETTLSVFESET